MDAEQLAETTKLVTQIGLLRDNIIWAVIILAAMGTISFVLWMWMSYKNKRDEQTSKNARAKLTADSNNAQAAALRKLTESMASFNTNQANYIKKIDQTIANTALSMRDLQGTLTQVDVLVKRVLEKQDGVASLPTSVMVVQTYFYKVLFSDAVFIVHKSMHENDYKNRAAFIANKVKTDIGKIMTSMKAELSDLDLAFNTSMFFKTENDASSERYILVDLIWEAVKPLYLSNDSLYNRLEEASYKIMNTIKDHFATIRHENIEGTATFARYDRNKFRTPISLRPPTQQ